MPNCQRVCQPMSLGRVCDVISPQAFTSDGRPRARGLGITTLGEPGPLNAITDVPGVEVGVVTLIDGDGPLQVGRGPVRTGVTAVLPRGRSGSGSPVPRAGIHSTATAR